MLAGGAATVLIAGDAGIGKTRLVNEFGIRARRRGALVAMGVCVPIDGGGLPYAPVAGILRELDRQVDGLVIPTFDAVPDDLAKTRLFESILKCLVTLASRFPVVIVFEDLQWADSASAQLLGFLTRNLVDSRVLVVGTYRSDEVARDHRWRRSLNELARHPRVTH